MQDVNKEATTNPQQSAALKKQVKRFVDTLVEYNALRPDPRLQEDYAFLQDFFPRFLEDRNNRADEVSSPEYRKIVELAHQQFPHKPLWILCVDGRVMPVLAFGASANIGRSIRIPGGILREFVLSSTGELRLLAQSNFVQLLQRTLEKSKSGTVAVIFDSHIGCAARNAEEIAIGKTPTDAGLLIDVLQKKHMGKATVRFVQQLYQDRKHIVPIQTSFDPRTGFLYMGLETKKALEYVFNNGRAYTEDMLRTLVDKEYIISTEQLATNQEILTTFSKYDFLLAWKSEYLKSAKQFWQAINELRGSLLPLFMKKLQQVYSYTDQESKEGLHERALLLLANTFSGYLQNRYCEDDASLDTVETSHKKYGYGVHREEGVKISEGSHPPYKISMFSVSILEEKGLPTNIELAVGLVRANRKETRILNDTKFFSDENTFTAAPVPIVMQELVSDDRLTETDWEEVCGIDWSDLAIISWENMSDMEFNLYLEKKGKITLPIANGIMRLRKNMALLLDPEQIISHHLVEHDEVILPVIADKQRRIRCVIPFIKLGFS